MKGKWQEVKPTTQPNIPGNHPQKAGRQLGDQPNCLPTAVSTKKQTIPTTTQHTKFPSSSMMQGDTWICQSTVTRVSITKATKTRQTQPNLKNPSQSDASRTAVLCQQVRSILQLSSSQPQVLGVIKPCPLHEKLVLSLTFPVAHDSFYFPRMVLQLVFKLHRRLSPSTAIGGVWTKQGHVKHVMDPLEHRSAQVQSHRSRTNPG